MQTSSNHERIEVVSAELQADGQRHPLPLAAMTRESNTTFEQSPILGERTRGQTRHSAFLEWSNRPFWNLLVKSYGGAQRLTNKEFTLEVVVAGDSNEEGVAKPRIFKGFRFQSSTEATYLSEG